MKNLLIFSALLILVLTGCRREDIRELVVEIPSLTESHQTTVREAFGIRDQHDPRRSHVYDGIDPNSFVFDFEKKTVTIKYDSMKIAQSNIRYAIDEKGVKVAFPEKTDTRAGH